MGRTAAAAIALALAGLAAACADRGAAAARDAGEPGDSDSEQTGDPCDGWPQADDNFLLGSTPRNYTFYDAAGEARRLCDFADRALALLVISGGGS